jgi:Tfp pilus assembly protein PilV
MHRKLSTVKRFAGLTLIEVVAASVLLAVVMIPILKCLTLSHITSIQIEHKTRSLILAQAKLDQIKVRSIYDYTNGGDSFTESNGFLGDSYLCNVTDNSGDPLKTIVVKVGFDSNSDGTLSNDEVDSSLATLIARRWNN